MYAKIAMIKNKLRSKGIKDPVVMMSMSPTKGQKLNMYGEQTTVTNDGSKLSDKHKAGGPNSQFEKDGSKKRKKIAGEFPGSVEEFDKKYGTGKVNPYGKGATANPENMSRSSGG